MDGVCPGRISQSTGLRKHRLRLQRQTARSAGKSRTRAAREQTGKRINRKTIKSGTEKKHLCCKSRGWRWIFLPGGAALDEAVQDREQLTQHSDQSFYGFSSG